MIGWVRLPTCPPFFCGRCGNPSPIGKKPSLVLWQPVGRKRISTEIPDAIHPKCRVSRVERLAQRVELHRGVVGRNDPVLDAALEPAERRRELVAFKEELASAG